MKKLSKLFLQHLPVPIWHIVKSFEVVIITCAIYTDLSFLITNEIQRV